MIKEWTVALVFRGNTKCKQKCKSSHRIEVMVLDTYYCLQWDKYTEKSQEDWVNMYVSIGSEREIVNLNSKMYRQRNESYLSLNYLFQLLWSRYSRGWQRPQAWRICGKFCVYECAAQFFPAWLHACQSLWKPGLSTGNFSRHSHAHAFTLSLFSMVPYLYFYCFPFPSIVKCSFHRHCRRKDSYISHLSWSVFPLA
jgi:hypothetical protein